MSQFNTPVSITLDELWHSAGLFTSATKPRPNWNGFMQDISNKSSTKIKNCNATYNRSESK